MGAAAQEFENWQRENRLGRFAPPTKGERGLESRYEVHKINDPDGKHDACRYFVLDPQHDPIARAALARYAEVARAEGYDDLADDLDGWADRLSRADEEAGSEAQTITQRIGALMKAEREAARAELLSRDTEDQP